MNARRRNISYYNYARVAEREEVSVGTKDETASFYRCERTTSARKKPTNERHVIPEAVRSSSAVDPIIIIIIFFFLSSAPPLITRRRAVVRPHIGFSPGYRIAEAVTARNDFERTRRVYVHAARVIRVSVDRQLRLAAR